MTQQRIDDLQKAIKTGLPIEINPKAVLEIISMLAAEKRRADALDPAIEDMKQSLCCGEFRELSEACSELWRIWDQNAPSGAESEGG